MGCGLSSVNLPVDRQGKPYEHCIEGRKSFDDRKQEVIRTIPNIDESVLNTNRDRIMEELGGFRKLLILALTEKSLRIRFSNSFGAGNMKESVLIQNREDIIGELGGFRSFLIAALANKSSGLDDTEVRALRKYISSSDPIVSHHIHSVTNNLCDLVNQFLWLQRKDDTYSPQFDWIQARLIYDFASKTAVIIKLLPLQLSSLGKVYSVGVRCQGQVLLSEFRHQSPRPRDKEMQLLHVNGIADGMRVWIGSEYIFQNTDRISQLKGINKYLMADSESNNIKLENAPQIKLLDPAIDDAVYLFLEPNGRKHAHGTTRMMRASGWSRVGDVTAVYSILSIPLNVWECPLRNMTVETSN